MVRSWRRAAETSSFSSSVELLSSPFVDGPLALEERIGCKLASLAAGGTEEIAIDVFGDAGRFDIILQTLVEAMSLSELFGIKSSTLFGLTAGGGSVSVQG